MKNLIILLNWTRNVKISKKVYLKKKEKKNTFPSKKEFSNLFWMGIYSYILFTLNSSILIQKYCLKK